MNRLLFLLAAFVPVLAFCDVPSDPAGAFRILLRGNSDTIVSLPLHRPALVEASIQTRTGNQLELSDDVSALPAEGAYILIMSGALEGAVLPITALTDRTLTVDPGSYDLSTLHTESVDGLAEGAIAAVIPYWTLDTVFPAGAGVQVSTNRLAPKTQILLFNDTVTGTNLSSTSVYYYFIGNGSYAAGWYCFGDTSPLRGNTRLPVQGYFIVNSPSGADTELILTGGVRMSGYRFPVATLQASQTQDNFIALPVPVPVTLDASQLHESGAFVTSPSRLVAKDQLLVFDNSVIGHNKSASAVYFYFAGNSIYSSGWYRFGDMSQTVGGLTLQPGNGYIIRKSATPTAETRFWSGLPSYLQ